MPLVFNGFPSMDIAREFARATTERHGLAATVYDDSVYDCLDIAKLPLGHAEDIFIYQPDPPIVLVERVDVNAVDSVEREDAVRDSAEDFGGDYLGT